MTDLPKKCLVDTNVPKTANLATNPSAVPDDMAHVVLKCVEAIDHVVKSGKLVIDARDEIFEEYRRNLAIKGQPGIGDRFLRWVHDTRWSFEAEDVVLITPSGESYEEFPVHQGLVNFDRSDRKFVAVANQHAEKPPILQATDCKWWGWKDALLEVGITVMFLAPEYVRSKYQEKMHASN
jgi:hypothetical protein